MFSLSKVLYSILVSVVVADAHVFPAQIEQRSESRKRPVVGMDLYRIEYGQIKSWGNDAQA